MTVSPGATSMVQRAGGHARWEPASKRELVSLTVFFAAAVIVSDVVNVRLGVELLTVIVAIAALTISRTGAIFLRDWWFYLAGLLMWHLSGPIAARSPVTPQLDVFLQLDRLLFFGHDPVVVVQQSLAHPGHIGPIDIGTAIVYNMHLAEPYLAAFFLWRLNRLAYLQFAAAVLILVVASFVTYIFIPAVPPWLAAAQYGRVPGVFNGFSAVLHWHPLPFHGTPILYVVKLAGDSVAAFPSQHAALPMLELLFFSRVAGRKAVIGFSLWTAAVLFTVVYLGEHWVVDAIAGYVYALLVFGLVLLLSEGSLRRRGAYRAEAVAISAQ